MSLIIGGPDFYLYEFDLLSKMETTPIIIIRTMVRMLIYTFIIAPLTLTGVTVMTDCLIRKETISFSRMLQLIISRLARVFAVYFPEVILLLILFSMIAESYLVLLLIPVLVYYIIKSSAAIPIGLVEDRRAFSSLQRSFQFIRGKGFKVLLQYIYLMLGVSIITVIPGVVLYLSLIRHYSSLPKVVVIILVFLWYFLKISTNWAVISVFSYFLYQRLSSDPDGGSEVVEVAADNEVGRLPVLETVSIFAALLLILYFYVEYFRPFL